MNHLPYHLKIYINNNKISKTELLTAERFSWEIISTEKVNPQLQRDLKQWVDDYINKKNSSITLPFDMNETPPFTQKVLQALLNIPFGKTLHYQELAHQLNKPKASRAVGNGCGRNPFILLVPCHRILAKNGIGGFSSGLDIKKVLLTFEGSYER